MFIRTTRTRGGGAVVVAMVRVVGVGMAVADGGDEGDGMMLMEVVTKMVTRVEWQRGGDGEARVLGDRVDPVMRFTFGLGRNTRRKTFPAAVSRKRWRPEVAAGLRGRERGV
ncbi:hypothetical protein Tco_1100910 [Tanacetum coccineum]